MPRVRPHMPSSQMPSLVALADQAERRRHLQDHKRSRLTYALAYPRWRLTKTAVSCSGTHGYILAGRGPGQDQKGNKNTSNNSQEDVEWQLWSLCYSWNERKHGRESNKERCYSARPVRQRTRQ